MELVRRDTRFSVVLCCGSNNTEPLAIELAAIAKNGCSINLLASLTPRAQV